MMTHARITLATDIYLTMADYDETDQAEETSRALPPHMEGLTEWYGYGTMAGLRARGVYFTDQADADNVDDNGGDWGAVNWAARLSHVDIVTDDGVVLVTVHNRDHTLAD